MSGRKVLLLRHGQTAYNAQHRMQGQRDVPLDPVGRAQVAAVAPLVAAARPQALVSSDLLRARQTALALADQGPCPQPRIDPRLREISVGDWEGLTLAEAETRFPEQWAAWRSGADVGRGGGESYAQLSARAVPAVLDALDQQVTEGGLLVCVTHGGTARAVVAGLLELPMTQAWRVAGLGNCRWSLLEENVRGWRLVEHGVGAPATGAGLAAG